MFDFFLNDKLTKTLLSVPIRDSTPGLNKPGFVYTIFSISFGEKVQSGRGARILPIKILLFGIP